MCNREQEVEGAAHKSSFRLAAHGVLCCEERFVEIRCIRCIRTNPFHGGHPAVAVWPL